MSYSPQFLPMYGGIFHPKLKIKLQRKTKIFKLQLLICSLKVATYACYSLPVNQKGIWKLFHLVLILILIFRWNISSQKLDVFFY